jgi:DNA-binding transcriptional MerR regulator
MRIGQLARACGITVEAIRFYESRGLLRRPTRTSAGYRLYGPDDLEAVSTIRLGQRFGFTLAEIRQVMALYDSGATGGRMPPHPRGSHACLDEVLAIAERKLDAMDAEIARRSALRAELAGAIRSLRSGRRPGSGRRRPAPARTTATRRPRSSRRAVSRHA